MPHDTYLTTGEAASMLNVPQATLRWWRHARTGPKSFRMGPRKVMYRRSDVVSWVEAQYGEGGDPA